MADGRGLDLDELKRRLLAVQGPPDCVSRPGGALSFATKAVKVARAWTAVNVLGREDVHIGGTLDEFDARRRWSGPCWPKHAITMIGEAGLNNLRQCAEDVLANGVPGDFIETGVWRGGASIFMRGILKAHGVTDRIVYVADSFEGLPKPETSKYPQDRRSIAHVYDDLRVSLESVQENFRQFGLLDEQVKFLKGWFAETLPRAPIERLAILRLDGDMYGSTMDALRSLYPKLSVGGYLIIDDYGALRECRQAVQDYRAEHGIPDEPIAFDWSGSWWRRSV